VDQQSQKNLELDVNVAKNGNSMFSAQAANYAANSTFCGAA